MAKIELYLIDFDQHFKQHVHTWFKKHRDEYKNAEAMEAVMPALYETWLDTAADWLGGRRPQDYFEQYDDAGQLVSLLGRYINGGIGVPDPLVDRIVALGDRAEAPLLALLRDETNKPDVRLYAINMLGELASEAPLGDYIRIIAAWEDKDLADTASDALASLGDIIVEPVLAALKQPMDPEAAECLVDILSNHPGDKRIYQWLVKTFVTSPNKALFASDLGKFADADALGLLTQYLSSHDINYLDYIEIRNAIEQLGGDPVPTERDFTGDPYYETMKGIKEDGEKHRHPEGRDGQ